MKLKKIASLMLAGVMAVSMLAGCSTASNNGNGGTLPPAGNDTSTGLSAEVLNMSAFRNVDNINATESSSLNDAVKAAAAIMGSNNSAANISTLTQVTDARLTAAKSKMGTAKYVNDVNNQWAYVKNTADNDGHTVYDVYVIAQNQGDEVIKQNVAKKLSDIYGAMGVNPDVNVADSYSYDVSISMADWQVGKDADVTKDGVIVGIAITLHYDAAEFN